MGFHSLVTGSSSKTHSYNGNGTYTIQVRITNTLGVIDTENRTVYVSEPPPSSTPSFSMTNSRVFTNQPTETFDLVWPRFANTMNLSDGINSASNRVLDVSPTWGFGWGQTDGETRTLTATFLNGAGDTVGTPLSQEVTFDSALPVISNVSATRTDGALSFSLSATDQHSGVSKVEISNGTTTVEHAYATSINSSLSGSNFSVRVMDLAGNWSNAQNIAAANVTTPPPASAPNQVTDSVPGPSGAVSGSNTVVAPAPPPVPRVAMKSKTAGASIARQAGVSIAPGSKVSISVAKASKKICRVSGGRLVALKPGNCQVTVSVTPKKTKILKKPKAVRTPTTVVVG
jgi:hypothetical protein